MGLAPRCLNQTGREGKQDNENFVSGSLQGEALADKLRTESAYSIFDEDGFLAAEAIADSQRVIPGEKIGNPVVRDLMTADGSDLRDWGKYSTRTHQSPYGDFQVHYYYNPETGKILLYDYKVVMNRR
uniref:hypothetical protein n=1 Tax=Streptomyces fradiae TaxID=1906 RepID=UPI004046A501